MRTDSNLCSIGGVNERLVSVVSVVSLESLVSVPSLCVHLFSGNLYMRYIFPFGEKLDETGLGSQQISG